MRASTVISMVATATLMGGCWGFDSPDDLSAASADGDTTSQEDGRDPPFCGGIAGIQCPDDLLCVDDPADDCDPDQGGADCGGLCVSAPLPECRIAGCSSQLCIGPDDPGNSTCQWEDWYECLDLTQCGNFAPDGACAWDDTAEYLECLEHFEDLATGE